MSLKKVSKPKMRLMPDTSVPLGMLLLRGKGAGLHKGGLPVKNSAYFIGFALPKTLESGRNQGREIHLI